MHKALDHHKSGEYEASMMLVLSQVDGPTLDFTEGKFGFFWHGNPQHFTTRASEPARSAPPAICASSELRLAISGLVVDLIRGARLLRQSFTRAGEHRGIVVVVDDGRVGRCTRHRVRIRMNPPRLSTSRLPCR